MLAKTKVKYIQSLGQKKVRKQEGVFVAEGPKIVADLFAAENGAIQQIYATAEWISDNQKLIGHIEVIEITESELSKISQLATPNAVLAIVKQFDTAHPAAAVNKISLVLDDIRDPGNLGTIIRIADWFALCRCI